MTSPTDSCCLLLLAHASCLEAAFRNLVVCVLMVLRVGFVHTSSNTYSNCSSSKTRAK